MDGTPAAISPNDLYACFGTMSAPMILDVRRRDAFEADDRLIAGAMRCEVEEGPDWPNELPARRPVVVYCADGQKIGQTAAAALRGAGVDAAYLEGGIAGWREWRLPTRKKLGIATGKMGDARAAENRPHCVPLANSPLH